MTPFFPDPVGSVLRAVKADPNIDPAFQRDLPTSQVTANYFYAFYEDAKKAKAAACKEGWTPKSDASWHDYVDVAQFVIGKRFPDLDTAVAWLQAEIGAEKTVFGYGDINERHPVERRCKYCICDGVQTIRRIVVDDTGIAEEFPGDMECLS